MNDIDKFFKFIFKEYAEFCLIQINQLKFSDTFWKVKLKLICWWSKQTNFLINPPPPPKKMS